jgi:protease YdgD
MRILAAAAIIALSVLFSLMVNARDHRRVTTGISGASPISLDAGAVSDKQTGNKPLRQGNDSCRWAHDNECDDPGIGTGACPLGTDYSDCRALREGENDSCRWARDGECDEPHLGTGACVQGTDRTDCGDIAWMRNENDNCATAFNGACEAPASGGGRGACAAHTDRADCHGRDRPMTINDHFFGRDDRVRVNAQLPPWRFMGQFTNGAGEGCTATLIARDVIVTAAHCIHTDNGVQADGEFEPAGGGASAHATAYLVNRDFNYQRFNTTEEIAGLDWALLRLDRPLGDRLGHAGVRNLIGEGAAAAVAAELYQAGYAWDTGATLSAHVRCHMVETFSDGTFSHQCDTTHGDSGSAFLVRSASGAFDVIGVDSSFRSNPKGPIVNIAVSAASFQASVADFVAGRSGAPISNAGAAKPKQG